MFNYNKCRERVRLQKHSAKQFKSILFLKLPSLHGFFMPFLGETATSAPGFHIFRGHHKFSDITRVKSVSELSCQKDSGVRKTFKVLYFEDHKQCNSVTFRFFFQDAKYSVPSDIVKCLIILEAGQKCHFVLLPLLNCFSASNIYSFKFTFILLQNHLSKFIL